jgi:hypothetical protein
MYNPIQNGSSVFIKPVPDEKPVECYIPPVGYIQDETGKLIKIGVARRSNIFADCYWEIDKRWSLYKQWKAEEDSFKKGNPDFQHSELTKFINDCWRYRLGGFWFYNNDEPTYITGHYWYYLSVYYMETGKLPEYRNSDKLFFYFWQYCKECPHSYGMLYLTMRRQGKSSKAGAIALDMTSSNASYNSGIQSKTDDDAKSLFRKNIIAPYRKFPYFFQVAKSNIATNGKVPEKELRFIGNKSDEIDDELDSKVDFKPSLAVAYDGSRLGFYIADEVGKPQNVDINQRWDIVQFCLRDFDGSIIGKTIHTTTVEDMGGAAEKLMNMWQNSDVHSITEEKKQTGTGMFRFFLPAQESLDVDKYGNPLVEQSMQKILSERKAKENDSRALASVIRKMPTTIKEAFQSDSENCAFNPIILTKREDELKWTNDGLYETGNFYWEDEEEFGKVKFVENPNGRFKIAYHPDESIRNAHILKFGTRMPLNNAEFAAGVDTFDHKLKEGVMSKGAIVVIKKTSPMHPSLLDEGVACMYKHRPENPEDFYMDVVKCLLYYGCEALIEVNKPALQYFLDKKGLEHYSALLPSKNQRGISASTQSNSYLADITDQYINNYCDKVNFIDLIQEWKAFDVGNTTKSDVAMAFGYARMLCKVKEEKLQNKAKITNIKQIISWYKN